MEGLREEEQWRPDRIGTLETREIKRGRQEGLCVKSGRETEGDCLAHLGRGAC